MIPASGWQSASRRKDRRGVHVTPATGACPADWALKGKVAKNGAFTCVPAKGVKNPAKPEKGLECPAGTGYFTKGKTLGCEAN